MDQPPTMVPNKLKDTKKMLPYFTYSQKIEAFFTIAFLLLAALPQSFTMMNMWLVLFTFAGTTLIADLMFSNEKQFVFEPEYGNWMSRQASDD